MKSLPAPVSPPSLTEATLVIEWELTGAPPAAITYEGDVEEYSNALLLIRLATEPLGLLTIPIPVTPHEVARVVWAHFADEISQRVQHTIGRVPEELPVEGLRLAPCEYNRLPFIMQRASVLDRAPAMSVVIATRGRPERLASCLERVTGLAYPNYEVVLVDNAPVDAANRQVVEAGQWQVPVRYVSEPRPGLSWARNTGARTADGSIVAFLDDDELADQHWLTEYASAFLAQPDTAAAAGMILPQSLRTPAERFFEQIGGHSKGRGFHAAVYDKASHSTQHPLYPLPPFGAGGNMAFRKETLIAIGFFDVALGAGTPARGNEDTAAFADVMLAGFSLAWQPSAFVYHSHYESFDNAVQQQYGYGLGLTAFYTRMILEDPRRLGTLLRLAPRGFRDVLRQRALIESSPIALPGAMRRAKVRGMLKGPIAYGRSRMIQARVREQAK